MTFPEFFKTATGGYDPYPYQVDFVRCSELLSLISVPTGYGKTAAIILGWLWRRRFASLEIQEASDDRVFTTSGAEANSVEIDVLGHVP